MNLKQTVNRKLKGHADQTELNLTAVMNVFLILIPFLLLTAVFVKITVLELSLPRISKDTSRTVMEKPASIILNILLIKETGFQLKSPDLTFAPIDTGQTDYKWDELAKQLDTIKKTHPESNEIIISPENTIKYDTIIGVMDRCREAGLPNISISG
ncbi:biopolymer transporter ExbD [candidate division KSB1 bacterium]|nr:biopolymer transporter ExbD [candidate division KSB1 bacterium]